MPRRAPHFWCLSGASGQAPTPGLLLGFDAAPQLGFKALGVPCCRLEAEVSASRGLAFEACSH